MFNRGSIFFRRILKQKFSFFNDFLKLIITKIKNYQLLKFEGSIIKRCIIMLLLIILRRKSFISIILLKNSIFYIIEFRKFDFSRKK